MPDQPLTPELLQSIRSAFDQEHHKTFGHAFTLAPVEVACLRVVSRVPMPKPPLTGLTGRGMTRKAAGQKRRAYFGRELGFVDAPVLGEADLGRAPLAGPVMIDKYDTTIVVPPGCEIYRAEGDSLVINTGCGEAR